MKGHIQSPTHRPFSLLCELRIGEFFQHPKLQEIILAFFIFHEMFVLLISHSFFLGHHHLWRHEVLEYFMSRVDVCHYQIVEYKSGNHLQCQPKA
jgi:hypothetical protein